MIKDQCLGFINTPPLWKGQSFGIQQFDFPAIEMGSFRPEKIASNLRLGHQMEYVFKQLVEHSKLYEILIHNLQIENKKRTLGEVDFILEERDTGQLVHIELAYKFYIINETKPNPIHRLIGPNQRDTFYDKKEKILNSQFPLLHSKEGVQILTDQKIDTTVLKHQSCFKAQLFSYFKNRDVDTEVFNNDCIAGSWIRLDDMEQAYFESAQYYIPSKSEWVIQPKDDVPWLAYSKMIVDVSEFLKNQYAPMLWAKHENDVIEKFFVVWW